MTDFTDQYRLDFFVENGFNRQTCTSCGDNFWSVDENRDTCGEPPCGKYEFIQSPGFSEQYELEQMRREFLSFFESNNHSIVEPYPVAANRWRDDVLLTQASIYNFQPFVTSGESEPPENPLTISQPCIRMNDIENVGKTGRHTMAFEMMAHHVFNSADDSDAEYQGEVYWKEDTVRLCHEFLEHLGADLSDVTYIEDTWVGGGNAGLSFEVIYQGAELATLVFMSMEEDPNGEYEMKDGNTYSEMDTYVVDTGYGLERWTWVSKGSETVYDAVYGEIVDEIIENSPIDYTTREEEIITEASERTGKMDIDDVDDVEDSREEIADNLGIEADRLRKLMEPIEKVYAISDHTRTLAYMLGDRIVPSSSGTGYLVRKVIRRTIDMLEDVDCSLSIGDIVLMHSQDLGYENSKFIKDVLKVEEQKYKETLRTGRERISSLVSQGEKLHEKQVVDLYKNNGIGLDVIEEVCDEIGAEVDIPDNFDDRLSEDNDNEGSEDTKEPFNDFGSNTELVFYDEPYSQSCEATVVEQFERQGDNYIVLDRTIFYPEGGGQPSDTGTIESDTETLEVLDVQKYGEVVIHKVDGSLPDSVTSVQCILDWDRRYQLMKNHTATHLVGLACRECLGDHVRQAGAKKSVEESRLDVTHYKDIGIEDIESIENAVNDYVSSSLDTDIYRDSRKNIQSEHGVDVYQGGVPRGDDIRIVRVGSDVQACAGTHVSNSSEIDIVRINRVRKVQDGVYRILFSVSDAVVDRIQKDRRIFEDTKDILSVEKKHIPNATRKFFDKSNEQEKKIEELKKELADVRSQDVQTTSTEDGTKIGYRSVDGDSEQLREVVKSIETDVSIATSSDGSRTQFAVFSVVEEVNAGEVAERLSDEFGGGGGGDEELGRGSLDGNVEEEVIKNVSKFIDVD